MLVFIHSFKLALINLGAILVGFATYQLAGVGDQIAIQVPVAVVFTVVGFVTWLWMTRRTRISWFHADTRRCVLVFALAPAWAAAIFVPLHYATQGYMTAWSNITAMWAFQIFANLCALLVARARFRPGIEQGGHA